MNTSAAAAAASSASSSTTAVVTISNNSINKNGEELAGNRSCNGGDGDAALLLAYNDVGALAPSMLPDGHRSDNNIAAAASSTTISIHNDFAHTLANRHHTQPRHQQQQRLQQVQKANGKRLSPAQNDGNIAVDTVFWPKSAYKSAGDYHHLRFSPYFTSQPKVQHQNISALQQHSPPGQLAVDALYRTNATDVQPSVTKWTYPQGQILNVNSQSAVAYAQLSMSATAAAAAAAAAAAVTKFEQAASTPTMNLPAVSGSFWPNGISSTTDWDSQTGLSKSDVYSLELSTKQLNGFAESDPRVIGTPPYAYNVAAAAAGNYNSCASNMRAAYLASYPQMPSYVRDTSAATAAAVAAAAVPFNFNFSAAAGTCGYGNCACPPNFADYCNLNYYGGGVTAASVAAMIGSSPSAAAALNPPEMMSERSSSSGNNITANVSEDFKSIQGINEDFFMNQDLSAPNLHNTAHKNVSPVGNCSVKPASKPKKSKKKKSPAATNSTESNFGGSVNGRAGSTSRMTPEPSSTHAFVWELEDLNAVTGASDNFTLQLVNQIVRCAFHVDPVDELNELNQVNIEDAEIDDTLTEHSELYTNTVINITNGIKIPGDVWTGNQSSIDQPQMAAAVAEMLTSEYQTATSGLIAYPEQPPSTSSGSSAFLSNGISSNNDNIDTASSANAINRQMLEGLRRIAMKYRNVRATYNAYQNDVTGFLDFCGLSAQKEEILSRLNGCDKIAGCALERYKRCLRIIVDRSQMMKEKSTNIVITQEPLIRSIVKVLMLGLASLIPIENIYSIQRIGRDVVFSRIIDRFKKQYAVTISSNAEMRAFSRQQGINCWFINNLEDVDKLYLALDTLILFDPTCPVAEENAKYNSMTAKILSADNNNKIYIADAS